MTFYRLLAALTAALALPAALPAAPYPVDDLNPGPSEVHQEVRPWGLAPGPDGVSYFSATDPAHGIELWRSDGTAAGTYRVTDICAGHCSSNPSSLRIFRGQILFSADDGFAGAELWATDGTPGGEHRVRDLCAGPCSSSPAYFAEAGGNLVFIASNGPRLHLWKTDGTREGTVRLKLLCTGDYSVCYPDLALISAGERAFFFDKSENTALWVTDGTVAGTRPFREALGGELDGDYLFPLPGPDFAWVWTGAGLWRSDGTAAGTNRLKAVSELALDPAASTYPIQWTTWNGLFFAALSTGELIRSDGTSGGTYRIAGVTGAVKNLVALDDEVLFIVDHPDVSSLWSSRGTADTTFQVIELRPSEFFTETSMVSLGDRALFTQSSFPDLWGTDGTAAGTRKLNLPELPYNGLSGFVPAGRQAYFLRDDEGRVTDDLWISDGSEAGTRRVKDFHIAPGSSGPLAQTAMGERLLFSAQTGEGAAPLFLTDGTAVGTHVLSNDASGAFDFARLGHHFLFSSQSGLWRTDGTAAGTAQVIPDYVDLSDAMDFGGFLYFPRAVYWPSPELWRSNGTADGTVLVKDIDRYAVQAPHHRCYSEGSDPRPALVLGGRLLLTANDGKHGREIWKSDGTGRGTRILLDLNPLRSPEVPPSCEDDESPRTDTGLSSDPEDFVALGDIGLFSATGGRSGRELWRTDGTPQRTRRVADLKPGPLGSAPHNLVVFHGLVYFFASPAGTGEALWRTDGTARGTALVRDLALGGFPSWGRDLTVAGDRLYFTVFNETTGAELWVSGGDTASTAMIGDLNPGPANAAPQSLTNVDGLLVFAADDGLTGLEPWRSDGTPAGTFPLADLSPGPDASSPGPFTRIRQVLITGADDGAHGREPWAIPLGDVLRP